MFYVYKYFIHDELVYIGKTYVGPYERYRQHVLEDYNYNKVTDFEVMEIDTEIDMDILESYFIAKYNPVWNIKDTDKSVPKINITYPYVFNHYSYNEFVRLYGFGKTKSPISRNRLKELSNRPRLSEFELCNLAENAKYTGRNKGFEVVIPQWFCEELQKFNLEDNPDIKLLNDDSSAINYRVEVEDCLTGLKDSVYFVDYVYWKNGDLWCKCFKLSDVFNNLNIK